MNFSGEGIEMAENRRRRIVSCQTAQAQVKERPWKTLSLFAIALASCLFSVQESAAQCQNNFTAVPLNVQQTYIISTDPTNTGTFTGNPCDPYGKGVFDTFAHGSQPEQAEEGPIPAAQIVGAIFGNYYVGGTPGAEYIQFTPTSNPGFAYVNIVTYFVKSPLLGVVTNTITFFVAAAPLPTVTAISTAAGPTTGATSFTLTGTNFTGATGVSFGGTAATSFTVNSAASITVASPAHAAGQVDITVTTPNGTSATSPDDQFTFVTPPAITSLTPTSGTTAGGTTVTLTGTNLSGATQILFNGVAGTSISSTATSATVTTPAHAAGQVDVTLVTSGGTSSLNAGDHYTFIAPPTAGASSATVAYNSSANAVTLNTSGGPTSVTVATNPSHGTATASGTNITYTPTTGFFGSDSFTYTATNSVGTSTAATVTITVTSPPITVTPTTLTSGTFGTAYSQTLSASGGQSPYTFSTTLASGALPSGLSLSSAGVISGTPTAAGTFTFTASGTDSSTLTHANFTSTTITLVIAPVAPGAPNIGTATAGNLQASVAFTAPASNGGAAITSYTVTASPGGATATGFTSPITVTGLTNGTAYTFTVTATNSAGTSPASSPSNSVTPIGSPIAGASSATVAYNSSANPVTLNLSGGTPTSVTIASVASHGTATASGTTITYTPVTGFFGSDSFTYTATNGFGTSSAATVSVTVTAPTITVSPTTLPTGIGLVAYSQQLTATGGKSPYTFSTTVASGALPSGFSLSSTGVVSGTTAVTGTYTFTVTGTDSSTLTHATFTSSTITLVINSALPVAPGIPTIGTATAGNAQATVTFTPPTLDGGAAITSYTVTSSPGGITAIGAASPITVTGLTNGVAYTFTVAATNSAGTGLPSFASNSVTPIAPPIAGATSAVVPYGSGANVIALNLTGGAPTSVAVVSPAVHGSATASGTTITYTPSTSYYGTDTFTFNATNGTGTSSTATATITINGPIITITPTNLTSDTVGSAYSQTLSGNGGQSPYTFSTPLASGALPAGLSLSSTGAITGTPTTAGTSTFTVTGTDSSTPAHASFTSTTISITINAVLAGAPTIGTATAGDAQATVTFTPPASTGGSPITSYTVTSSPGGITASGSASPITVTGLTDGSTYTFTVTATNVAGVSSASSASNAVTPVAAPVAGAASLTVAYDSTANPVTLNLTGGTAASVAVAAVASHGTATASGTTITYTPATGFYGSDSFTYTATNGTGTSSAATVTVTISAPAISITPTTLTAGTFGAAYSQSLMASGGQAPYTFSTTPASGSLPPGLTLSSSGVITGTPTAAGTFTFTVSGTDSSTATHANFTSATLSLTINAGAPGAPTIGTATAGNGQATVTFTAAASNGGSAITSYTVTSNPGGLTATGSTSPITVTGLANGTAYTFTVTATNAIGTGPASAASNSITPKSPQTITFANPGTQSYNSSPTLSATSTSGLAVSFTSSTPGVCAVTSGGLLSFVAAGTCTINADQSGSSSYLAATTVTQSFTVSAVVPGAPTIGTATAGNGQASVAFNAPASNGGSAITGYTVTSSPGGITGTGTSSPIVVTGLTNGTAYTFTVTATNSAGTSTASAASNSITPSTAVTAGATSATVAYSSTADPITLNLSGGAPTSVAVASPASHGTATASGTTITYTPTTGYYGTDSFTYTATNASGTSAPATVTITISAPVISISPAILAVGTVGVSYSQTITASGGKAPYTFSNLLASGALPAGITLSSAGAITGTPTAGGTFTFRVTGTDSSTGSGPATFTSAALSLTIAAIAPGAPTVGAATTTGSGQASVAFTPPVSNGGAAITAYTVTSSPGGLTATGSASPITVTGLTNGTAYTFTVTATNSAGTGPSSGASNAVIPQSSQSITFTNPGTQSFGTSPTLAATATSGLAVTFTSTTTAVCTVTTSGLVTFVTAGSCTVNANQSGNAAFSAANQVTQSFTVSAIVPGVPIIGAASAGNGQSTVSFTPPSSNGGSPITLYTVTSSPGGITAAGTGSPITVSGLANGTAYTFTITATNIAGTGPSSTPSNTVTPSATVTATRAIASITLTQNHAAPAFTPVLGGSGVAPLAYSVSPALPTGLSLSSTTGAIAGTPTAASPATTYTVTVTDTSNATATANFSLAVNVAVSTTTGTTPPTLIQGVAVTPFTPITGLGGTAPFTYAVSPALPAGLSINPATGQITGTPTAATAATLYTVTVTDANGAVSAATFSLAVAAPLTAAAKSVTAAYNSNGTTSTSIDLTSSITGGTAISVTVATPPSHGTTTVSGLVVTYTPTTGFNGLDSFTYTASNATSTSASATVSVTIPAPAISAASSTLPGGAIGIPYSRTLAPTGGASPYTFSTTVSSGTLPAGLTLSSTGVISGTPTTACTCTFTLTGTDSSTPPAAFTLTLSLTIVAGPPTVTAVTPALGLAAGGATVTLTGTNFTDTSIVSFGNTSANSVDYVNASTLTAVVPAGTGVVDVTVTTAGGTSSTSRADQFTYLAQAGSLSNPLGTTVDGNGNTFIADPTLGYIVEVPAGCASIACEKIIGGGLIGLTGVTVDSNGNLVVLSGGSAGIVTEFPYDPATNSYGASTTIGTGLDLPTTSPTGVTVDDMGNLFVTDTADHTVVEGPYNNATGTYGTPITLTTGSAQSTPSGVTTDANGDVFYADPGTGTIDELTPGSSTPIILASGVNAQSVTIDASGDIYYTDSVANTVTKIPFDGTSYGTPVVIAIGLSTPYGISVDDNGNLLVANNGTKALVKVTVDTPPSFAFASTKVGATSTDSPQTATLANIGTTALTFPPTSGPNPALTSGYVLAPASTCPQVASTSSAQTVAEGASCVYAISFSPETANIGTDTGNLTATDDNLNLAGATQSIPLTAIALADDTSAVTLTVNPASSVVFGKSVAITAAVHDTTVPATIPTGSVAFTSTDSASTETTIASAVPLTSGSATVPVFKPSAAGTYTLTANYAGAIGDIAASSGTASLVVTKATPILAYAPSPATQTFGTAIPATALDATALDANGAAIPGTFVFTTTVNSVSTTLIAGTTVLPAATYTITATFTPTDTADYTSGGTVTATYTVTHAPATIALSNLSYSYNGQPHSATATTTPAGLTVAITYSGTATPPTQGGSYPVVATIQDADYTGTATGTLVIARVPVDSVTLVANPNPVLTTTSVTLTATVLSSLGTPTGMVNFIETGSGTVFATAPLVNGVATFTTNAEPLGVYNLVATYLGDADFLPLTSPVFVSTVLDFTLGISTASGSSSTATAAPGGTANYQFSLAPDGSPTFTDPVNFTVSGQPAGSTYTITPPTIPAGSGPTPVALAIVLPQNSALLHHDLRKLAPIALAILLLPFARRMRQTGRRLARVLSLAIVLIAGIGITVGLSSCGPASGFYGGSPGGPKTYTITLTGTSGKLTHSTTVTLTVP